MPKPGYKLANWYFGKYEEIPEEWSMNLMKDLCKVRQGLQIPISERFNESGPNRSTYITVKAVHSGKFEEFIENPGKRVVCTKDDILFTRTGNTGEIITNIEGVFHNNFFLVDFDRKILSKNYLIYFLKQGKIQGFIRGLAGSTTIPDLNHDDFFRLLMPVPPIEEQKKIASILNTVDNLIAKYDSIIDSTKLLKQGLMQTLLTKGIGHKKFKIVKWYFGKEIEIPEDWEVKTIDDSCNVLDSERVPLNSEEREKISGEIPYYGANGVQGHINKYLFDEDLVLLAEDGGYFDEYQFRPIAYFISGKSWVNNHAHVLSAKSNNVLKWIFYSLVHKNILPWINGSTRTKLNQSDLKQIQICIPSIQEQQKIASILDGVDSKISELESKKTSLEKLKKGLMQKLLTGQIRV